MTTNPISIEPAFPIILAKKHTAAGAPLESDVFPGISIRDYFAAAALQGMCSNGYLPASRASEDPPAAFTTRDYAKKAYEMADAMLKARQ